MASAARLDPFDDETYDIFRASLVAPSVRARVARDMTTWSNDETFSLTQALWWERAVYERAVRLFERRVLAVRVQCDASAYMTHAASRVPDLYYPHEVNCLRNQLRARASWRSVLDLVGGVVLNYADATNDELRAGLSISTWIDNQKRSSELQKSKLSEPPSFAPSTSMSTQCRRCKSTSVTVNLRQLRSADEPMTQLYACVSCRFTWRVG